MWGSLCHKFVLPLLGIYEDKSAKQLFLVSPYMKNGTLAQWRKSANPSVTEVDKRVWFFVLLLFVYPHHQRKILEVAKGIEYIHSEGVVHGDLRGVFYSKHNMCAILNILCRTISSWMPTFMLKSPTLD